MGLVSRFPVERVRRSGEAGPEGPLGAIVILPVIRIERHGDAAPPIATHKPLGLGEDGDRPTRGTRRARRSRG